MISDNGGAFVAKETQKFVAMKNITWNFSLTKAPWCGGMWERLVQSTKRCLKKVLGGAILTYQEIETVLLEIEVILNSRPLYPLFDDDMTLPLTPNHLLFGRKLGQINCEEKYVEMSPVNATKRARYVETVIQHFWDRWRKDN